MLAGCLMLNPKRHLDLAELLDAGIDVVTTLSVQPVADELRRGVIEPLREGGAALLLN
jgi:hypothetical protein